MPKPNSTTRGRQKAAQKRTRAQFVDDQDADQSTGENYLSDSHLNPPLTISRIISSEAGSEQKIDLQSPLPRRFGLGSRAERLLDLLSKVERGELKKEDLGRSVRQSKAYRDTLHSTIRTCTTKAMRLNTNSPAEANNYLTLVQRFSTIQEFADDRADHKVFEFLKLPPEVRNLIYSMAVEMNQIVMIRACEVHPVLSNWGSSGPPGGHFLQEPNIPLLQTCRQIRQEAAPSFYRQNIFAFPCTCALSKFFKKCNLQHSQELRHLIFNWWGENRVHAISSLETVPLKRLEIVLDTTTASVPTEREQMLRENLVVSSAFKPLRLVDSLGFEELFRLRGLESIKLDPEPHLRRSKRLRTELEELQAMLEQIVVLPRTPQGLS